MRKIFVLAGTMVTLGFFVLMPCAFADSVELSVVSPSSVFQGSSFFVDVNISRATDLYDFQLDLNFTPSVLLATGVSEGSFLSRGGATFFVPGTIDNVSGTIAFNADTLLGAVAGVSGSGTLIQFDFTALSPGASTLTIGNEILQDSTGAILSDTTTPGTVTVTAVPEPRTLLLLTSGLFALLAICFRRYGAGGLRV